MHLQGPKVFLMQEEFDLAKTYKPEKRDWMSHVWEGFHTPAQRARVRNTGALLSCLVYHNEQQIWQQLFDALEVQMCRIASMLQGVHASRTLLRYHQVQLCSHDLSTCLHKYYCTWCMQVYRTTC